MYYSKNNIVVKINGSDEYAILNPLTGSFDLMNSEEFRYLNSIKNSKDEKDLNRELTEYLLERGYLFKEKSEEDAIIKVEFEKFENEIENSQIQLLLLPTYGCNLACAYCYEKGVEEKRGLITKEMVDAFFKYASDNFLNKPQKPFVTLFGGEPLINSPAQREIIEYIINKCIDTDFEIATVTNGFDLVDYVDVLKNARVKELQVTLDGSKEVHDLRRGTVNGKGTFDRIVLGMEKAIENKIPINFRTVLDNENIQDTVNLAEFLDKKGWLDLGQEYFKTQIGRNYELFECYAKPQHLLSQVELWANFVKLSKEYPVLKKFHKPDFKGIRHMVETGELYMASFDTCPAAKTEWVFDYRGDIYGCTASCGREEYRLGKYYPQVELEKDRVDQWQKRNVLNIEDCRECQYNVICGGGCGVVGANKSGKILSPDCRPIQELMDLGINYYINDIKGIADPEQKFHSGCLVCGEDLMYNTSKLQDVKCEYCGVATKTNVICKNGHFVCDDCHSKDILKIVENICINSDIKDPIKLANKIFELPELNMHGPEYHSIVPAILVTTYGNATNTKKISDIKEAIKRGKEINGGACGFYGACGAGIGTGIAYSIINKVMPLSKDERGNANKLTAKALMKMSEFGGPRCCKRDAVSSLEVAKDFIRALKYQGQEEYICKQFKENKDCIGVKCDYFPKKQKSCCCS